MLPIASTGLAWSKTILWFDLSSSTWRRTRYDGLAARLLLGGRGLAAYILYRHLDPGQHPLSPGNILVVARGPLTGLVAPGTSKVVVASRSPLTMGYGDGNIGGWAGYRMRCCGLDALVVTGRARRPSVLVVTRRGAWLEEREDLWGLSATEAAERLRAEYGRTAGVLTIGPAGERLVRYAVVTGGLGRSGGRPGIGAVMGSKNLKAIVFACTGCGQEVTEASKLLYSAVRGSPLYKSWMRTGTLYVVEWAREASVLPVMNFREAWVEDVGELSHRVLEKLRRGLHGCPTCNMQCGHRVETGAGVSELDYEGVAMLGSNLSIWRIEEVARLIRMADDYGVDVISFGSVAAFLTEARERGLVREPDLHWGWVRGYEELMRGVSEGWEGIYRVAARGVAYASKRIGGEEYAMHVKGLEVSGYDCHAAPGMALAYATSPVGAHHKDAWLIAWEVEADRTGYGAEKARKLVELQNIRGGFFESVCVCRFPWVELGVDIKLYLRMLREAAGISMGLGDIDLLGDRVYSLIRLLWVRLLGGWSRSLDRPPARWFREPLTKGPLRGARLDPERYEALLDEYYALRGWSREGIPEDSTLRRLGLTAIL